MPYRWEETERAPDTSGAFFAPRVLRLWPHRSLTACGFVTFIAASAALLALPLLALLGTSALWIILAFMAASLAAIWAALTRNNRDLGVSEHLMLTRDLITLIQRRTSRPEIRWSANPHWVRITLYPTEGPVPDYLTLSAEGREVELGRFLTPEERKALATELRSALSKMR